MLCDTTPDEERTVLEWLEADPANKREMNRLDEIFCATILHAPAPTVSAPSSSRLRSSLRKTLQYAAAAVAGVMLMMGGGYLFSSWRIDNFSRQLLTMNAPEGQRVDIILQDGTHVWLNGGSSLQYPAVFTGRTRRVRIVGEGMFDVAHDDAQPFIVETHAGNIEVLGTKFNVQTDEERNIFSTALFRGRVSVSNSSVPGERLLLEPGQRADLKNGHLETRIIEHEDDYLWTEGIIALNSASFAHLAGKIERAYNVRIQLLCPKAPVIKYRGKIHIAEGVEHAMKILLTDTGRSFEIDRETDRVYIR